MKIDISVAAPARWKAIWADCAGSVGSLVELLQASCPSTYGRHSQFCSEVAERDGFEPGISLAVLPNTQSELPFG